MTDTDTAEASYDQRILAQDGREWSGCLTIENAEAVAAKIARLLAGKLYSFAFDWSPAGDIDLHTSMKARDVNATTEEGHAIVSWGDGYGLHTLYTTVRDRAEGMQLSYEERLHAGTWLHFHGEQFTAESFALAGNLCRSTFRIEYPEHLSDDYA